MVCNRGRSKARSDDVRSSDKSGHNASSWNRSSMAAEIAIVTDNAQSAAALAQCLSSSSELHFTASCSIGSAALKSIPRKPPSLVLVDFGLADMPALECVRKLHL